MNQKLKVSPYIYPGLKDVLITQRGERLLIGCGLSKDEVYKVIENECGVTIEQIMSKYRHKEIVDARHILCSILYKNFGLTLKKIGGIIGGRDHSTIMHSLEMFRDRFETSEPYRSMVKNIYDKIGLVI